MMKVLYILVTILVLTVAASIKEELCEDCGPLAERLTLAQEEFPIQPAEGGMENELREISAEAIGDRIMQEVNGAKDNFDNALTRIADAISKDEAEQNEANLGI